jgi:hypothetical protein
MTDTPEPAPLDDLLAAPRRADAGSLRQCVFAATARPLRRRRWLRRGALAAALAACFAAGMLTMRLVAPAAPEPIARGPEPRPQEAPPAPSDKDPAPPPRQEGVAAALFREGDHFLNEEGDPAAALRCYTGALNAGSEDDAKFSPDDNWLLMAIKNARQKEARHANNDG